MAFFDEAVYKDVTSEGTEINFDNGVKVQVPKGTVPPNMTVAFHSQPAFAPEDVFVLPPNIQAASPTYLLSSSSESLNGDVILTVEHHMKVQTEEDAADLVFLVADSKPTKGSYHFREVESGHPLFKPGERVGTISTNHFSFWTVGKKIVKAAKKLFQGKLLRVKLFIYLLSETITKLIILL